MVTLVNILNDGNRDLQFKEKVAERRAEMASQCECLAAWVEGRECVCNKVVELPLSTKNLKKANSLIDEIEGCDSRLAQVSKISGCDATCSVDIGEKRRHHDNGMVYYETSNGHYVSAPRVTLPKAVLLAALREERLKLMIELQRTGIVSVTKDNIKTVPK